MTSVTSVVEQPDYRTFDITGSHTQLGYGLGQADPPFKMQFWWSPPPLMAFADSCSDVVHDLHPHLRDELDAYADAQHLNTRELWQMCCRVNLKARVKVSDVTHIERPRRSAERIEGVPYRVDGTTEGCSTFVCFISPAPQGQDGNPGSHVIVGRNYDYLPQQVRRQRIRFVPDCLTIASIGARGGVPGGRYDGINAHGLFASLHVVMTDTPSEDEVKPGVPFHLIARIVLETCQTAHEAVDVLTRLPHLSSLNYLLADATDAFVVEADPRCVRIIERESNVLAATNHYRHPDMRPLQGNRAFTNSESRLSFLSSSQSSAQYGASSQHVTACVPASRCVDHGSINDMLDYAETTMADRTAPMCGTSGALTTLWSCVAELTTRRIRYAAGAPGLVSFDEIPTL